MTRMISRSLLTISAFSLLFLSGCEQAGNKEVSLETDAQKASYSIGQQIGRGIQSQQMDVDVDIIALSIKDVLAGKESRLSQDEMRAAMGKVRAAKMAKRMEEANANKAKAEKYLAENKKKAGVVTTESGLQYEIITAGKGEKPKATDRVKVQYRGTLTDGTEFDSSYKRDKPAEFRVTGVIRGWTEALQLMSPGAKWKLTIPAELAYGARGRPNIPPNAVLIFDIELIEVVKAGTPKAAVKPPMPPTKK